MNEPKKPPTAAPLHGIVLLPCPFCGGDADLVWDDWGHYRVWCSGCAATITHDTELHAVAAWNRRRSSGLVNWIESEIKKMDEASSSGALGANVARWQLRNFRKMVKKLLGQ